jgi:hypothetical protein
MNQRDNFDFKKEPEPLPTVAVIPAHPGYFVLTFNDDGEVFKSRVLAWRVLAGRDGTEPVTIDQAEDNGNGQYCLVPDGQVISVFDSYDSIETFRRSVVNGRRKAVSGLASVS